MCSGFKFTVFQVTFKLLFFRSVKCQESFNMHLTERAILDSVLLHISRQTLPCHTIQTILIV